MKLARIALLSAFVLVMTGCVAGSRIELGPVKVGSWVQAHEWKPAKFYAKDGAVGSTLGFLSSEVNGEISKCEGFGVAARVSWDKAE